MPLKFLLNLNSIIAYLVGFLNQFCNIITVYKIELVFQDTLI